MTKKKELEEGFAIGSDIEWFQGNDSWIQCRTKDGIKFSIGGELFFKILGTLDFELVRHGKNWRAKNFLR